MLGIAGILERGENSLPLGNRQAGVDPQHLCDLRPGLLISNVEEIGVEREGSLELGNGGVVPASSPRAGQPPWAARRLGNVSPCPRRLPFE
jgi:hypothetical protein